MYFVHGFRPKKLFPIEFISRNKSIILKKESVLLKQLQNQLKLKWQQLLLILYRSKDRLQAPAAPAAQHGQMDGQSIDHQFSILGEKE